MFIKPLNVPRLYQHIAQEIEALIASGAFSPGERLPGERELAQSLKVSRSSLREALSELEMRGVLDIKVGSGAYVKRRAASKSSRTSTEFSPFDVLRARRIVETEAAALAARHASPEMLDELARILKQLAREMRSHQGTSLADREFHVQIARASGNAALAMLVERLWQESQKPLGQRMEALYVTQGRKRDNVKEHQAIFLAISAGDSVAARRTMRLHLLNAEQQRMREITQGKTTS